MASIFIEGSISSEGGDIILTWNNMDQSIYVEDLQERITLRPPYEEVGLKGRDSSGNYFWLKKADGSYFPNAKCDSNYGSDTIHFTSDDLKYIISEHPSFTGVFVDNSYIWDNYIGSDGRYDSWTSDHPYGAQVAYFDGESNFIEYSPISLSTPKKPICKQNNNGTYTLTWPPAKVSGGSIPGQKIKYRVLNAEGVVVRGWSTSRTFTSALSAYGYEHGCQWGIEAKYGKLTAYSGLSQIYKFVVPSVSIPLISINKTTGLTCTISWTAATLSHTAGNIYYDIYVADKYITSVSNGNLQYAFSRQQCRNMAPNSKIHIVTVAKNLSNSTSPAGAILYSTTSPVYFTYDFDVSLGIPKNITIIQNNNGTFTISWEQSPMENGSREYIYYKVISLSDGSSLSSWIKDLNFTAKITDYDFNIEYQISAKYDDGIDMLEVSSDPVSARFILPSIAAPYLMIDKESGNEVTLTWQPAVLMHTDGDVFYDILKNNSSIKTTQETSNYFGEMELCDWGKDPVTLKIKAHGTNLTNTDAGDLFVDSNEVTFTFIPSAPSGSKIAYFDGANWIPAQIYWYDGQNWILCMMSYHNGIDWQICSI